MFMSVEHSYYFSYFGISFPTKSWHAFIHACFLGFTGGEVWRGSGDKQALISWMQCWKKLFVLFVSSIGITEGIFLFLRLAIYLLISVENYARFSDKE